MRIWWVLLLFVSAGCAEQSNEEESPDYFGGIDMDFGAIFLQGLLIGVAVALVGFVIYLLLRDEKEG